MIEHFTILLTCFNIKYIYIYVNSMIGYLIIYVHMFMLKTLNIFIFSIKHV